MIIAVLVLYLMLVLSIGLLSHRLFRGTGEDFFLATRTIGPFVLLMSLFGTHMTSFSLLGASGEAYRQGVGVFALMASASAIVVPLVFFFVGIRLWAVGKRHGYLTQVQFFQARYQSRGLGVLLFAVLVLLVIPYLLIGVLGGGVAVAQITGGEVPQWLGSLVITAVVLTYVSYGGLRGTAWANTFQTLVFMTLGAVTFFLILRQVGGLEAALGRLAAVEPELLRRGDGMPWQKLLSYTLIPLSVGMFPHIFLHWLSARDARSFRLPMIAYPLCLVIVWVPSVLIGMLGKLDFPALQGPEASSVLVRMIGLHTPELLAGLLTAGVFAAIMSSLDSQVLALSTMFTQDVVRPVQHARGKTMSEAAQVRTGRWFVGGLLALTFLLSLVSPASIFKLGVWSFTGFAALVPLVVAALYWRRSTRAGAIAAVLTVIVLWIFFFVHGWQVPGYTVAGSGVMPVAIILLSAALVLIVVSLASRPPSSEHVARFFAPRGAGSTT